jgi:methylated-DNA-protein-cysteine methyltransferase-like protein
MDNDGIKRGFSRIHSVIKAIPQGMVATYGQIAALAGNPRGARTVVWALHSSQGLDLPCHRVVSKGGALAPGHIFGGQDVQRALLESEGVTFKTDCTIDMDRHQWRPEEHSIEYDF